MATALERELENPEQVVPCTCTRSSSVDGYVTEERIPRALKEWGFARPQDFELGLADYPRRQAAQHAGIHKLPALDRWEREGEW